MIRHRQGSMVFVGLWASAIAMSVAAATAAAPQVVGITSAILNDVRIANAASARPRPAILRERVALADQVQTGQRSQLQVMLLDRSVFTVGANARLTIDRFVYDPSGSRSLTASVAKGAFRFMSGRPVRAGASSINSPVAAIGIRGTIVDGVVGQDAVDIVGGERGVNIGANHDPEGATLVVLRGPGRRTQGGLTVGALTVTAGNRSVELDQPMLAAYVPYRGAAPIGPFTMSVAGLARLQDLIFPSLAERKAAIVTSEAQPYLPPPPPPPRGRGYRPPQFPDDDRGGGPSRSFDLPDFPIRPQGAPPDQRPPARPAPTREPAAPAATAPATTPAPTPDPTPTPTPTPAPTRTTTAAPASAVPSDAPPNPRTKP